MRVFWGVDWAETHHDVAVVDAQGRLLARRRIRDDAAGYQQLLQPLAEAGDTTSEPIRSPSRPAAGCWWPPSQHRPARGRDQSPGGVPLS